MLASAVLWWLRAGSLDLGLYLDMWLIGGLSLVIINGGLGILLPAGQATRRRAILLMVGLSILAFITSGLDGEPNILSPLRGPVILFYMDPTGWAMRDRFFATIGIGIIQLAVVALGLWAWMRWRDTQR
jgi:hypothetical protein